ncbi:hypothetical protein Bca52824_007203 [Brassica carinata]|uniref:Uncharacterized protein n=1 Tax=Brassica carinata TaxID=52824 RepID=A0A8X8B6S6_BRACI|nr:hypothetical protein Bca52824_007203 [Brassica carinata]
MKVSTEVEENPSESTLSKAYKSYLQKLVAFEKQSVLYNQVATRCICTLLDAEPHFSYRDNLLSSDVRNIISPDEVVSGLPTLFQRLRIMRLCCFTIRSLFSNEGKHGGELTVQACTLDC